MFVICAEPDQSAKRYGSRGREMYVYQDTAAATQNLLLMATSLGYGTCWVGAFDETGVVRVLGLPAGWRPVALVPVGRPAEQSGRRSRRPGIAARRPLTTGTPTSPNYRTGPRSRIRRTSSCRICPGGCTPSKAGRPPRT